ncbi:MAG: glycosyltransferase [Comamonadaceae bacterium]|nr:glycosyltransferase [Comamonadaceae bacterium]
MRILLIAYEFPPIISGQSLRWFYLANELAKLGVEVHVLCPDMPALPPFSEGLHPGVIVHRTWAGPYVGFSQSMYLRLSKRQGKKDAQEVATPVDPSYRKTALLNLYRSGRRFLDQVVFPDLRSEWFLSASIRLTRLLKTHAYDAVVASHEPGVSLMLGLRAQRISRLPLIADLADPIVPPHAPRWRQRFDLAFEAKVLKQVDAAVVTTEAAAELFMQRQGLWHLHEKFECITQGFPGRGGHRKEAAAAKLPEGALKMVYTGNFYEDFRSPAKLATALRSLKDLNIQVDFYGNHTAYHALFEDLECATFYGAVDHPTCLAVQGHCDVLLSLGNRQAFQVPGKVYEYLGAGVPILHVCMSATDEAGQLISDLGAGWAVPNEASALARAIREIHRTWQAGDLQNSLSRNEEAIHEFSWANRAQRYLKTIVRTVKASTDKLPA